MTTDKNPQAAPIIPMPTQASLVRTAREECEDLLGPTGKNELSEGHETVKLPDGKTALVRCNASDGLVRIMIIAPTTEGAR